MKRTISSNAIENVNGQPPCEDEREIALLVRWGKDSYAVELSGESTVADLKDKLFMLTEVLPKRQKVIGLPGITGKPASDDVRLSDLNMKPEQKVMLMGSREEDISRLNAAYSTLTFANDVKNDLDIDYYAEGSSSEDALPNLRDKEAYTRRLERRIQTTNIRIINEPRNGKKLLVLDLDYTLFDCKSAAETIPELGRPGLHQFLASMYRYYDIVIWSQTSWRWLEAKLTELAILLAPDYKISFVLDRSAMFSVTSRRGREERMHEVKALEIIWRKFPGRWDNTNTVHIDDLSRNFALNPQSGLKIQPFKNAPVTRATDRELFLLESYLRLIATQEADFSCLNHKRWKEYCRTHESSVNESTDSKQ